MRKAVLHLKKSDPSMRAIIERVGPCRMEFGDPMFLMFTLRRTNVLPTGDFGIRMAMHKHYFDRALKNKNGAGKTKVKKKMTAKTPKVKIKLPAPEQMEKIAKRWEPYRSIACWYLWRSLDVKTIG